MNSAISPVEFKVGDRAQFVGASNGKKCDFPVTIRERHPHADLPDYYSVDAVFAHNVLFVPDNWVHVRDLRRA